MNEVILQTHNLSKTFGEVTAVQNANFQVHKGSLFGFLGPNGAGKTTTIGMLLGLIHPTTGAITLFGEPLTPAKNKPLRRVGALIGAPTLVPYLSGRENLRMLARLHDRVDNGRVEEVLDLVGMQAAAGRKVKGYSTGMKQRIGLAAALLHQPELIILDEPTNGLDPAGMREVRTLLRQLAATGLTVFLSSHHLYEVEQLCDHIAVIHKGSIVTQGAVSTLLVKNEPEVHLRVAAPAEAAALLQKIPEVTNVSTKGMIVSVTGISSETAVRLLTQNGIIPTEVNATVGGLDLETLFLQLTETE